MAKRSASKLGHQHMAMDLVRQSSDGLGEFESSELDEREPMPET